MESQRDAVHSQSGVRGVRPHGQNDKAYLEIRCAGGRKLPDGSRDILSEIPRIIMMRRPDVEGPSGPRWRIAMPGTTDASAMTEEREVSYVMWILIDGGT